MSRWFSFVPVLAGALALFAAAPSLAQRANMPVTVVELFTSQGCNQCPPADAILLELVARQERENFIVLGFHVDYWDYLGWADTFATAATTARQRNYMRPLRMQSVYTPQIVVNGRFEAIASDRMAVDAAIEQARAPAMAGGADVRFDYAENGEPILRVEATKPGDFRLEADIWLVLFADTKVVPIARGENAGRTISYGNVVQTMLHLTKWDGKPATFPLPAGQLSRGASYCAAIVQMPNQGPILGAVKAKVHDGTW